MLAVISFSLFAFGLAIGSFLNVVIFRYDGEQPLFSFKGLGGRSHCMACKAQIKWYDLVPVFSYVFLRGKCRACKAHISPQYPLVELLTAAAFLLPALFFYPHYSFPVMHPYAAALAALWLPVIALMIILAGVDMRLMLIPDETVIGLSLVGFALSSYADSFLGAYAVLFPQFAHSFLNHLAGGLFGLALLGLIVLVSRGRAMGMGDVKLAGAMGLILGFPDIVFALALSFLIGGIWSAGLLLARWGRGAATMKTMVPFGPFMVLGFFIHIFYIEKLMAWYFALL
jgi:leader peptidase (prepilin peptidase) / N-methyltransferase